MRQEDTQCIANKHIEDDVVPPALGEVRHPVLERKLNEFKRDAVEPRCSSMPQNQSLAPPPNDMSSEEFVVNSILDVPEARFLALANVSPILAIRPPRPNIALIRVRALRECLGAALPLTNLGSIAASLDPVVARIHEGDKPPRVVHRLEQKEDQDEPVAACDTVDDAPDHGMGPREDGHRRRRREGEEQQVGREHAQQAPLDVLQLAAPSGVEGQEEERHRPEGHRDEEVRAVEEHRVLVVALAEVQRRSEGIDLIGRGALAARARAGARAGTAGPGALPPR
mmetsp:Transcript_58974/g.144639  ORF Transcript_58974/g.144639 Transcript_58974/m.144639 type:complete len:283 (-) Transcript_58974:109-957(-)